MSHFFKNFKSISLFLISLALFPLFIGSSNYQDTTAVKTRFSLTNYTVFSPGENVGVSLYSNIRTNSDFNFELFKIDDPVDFFSKIDRDELRINFDIWGKKRENLLKYTKMIKSWSANIPYSYFSGSNRNLEVGKIKEPGIYLLQAMKDNLVAYCGIVVTKYAMIYKNNGKEVLAYVANSMTGASVKNVKFNLYKDNKLLASKLSDKSGLALFKVSDSLDFSDRNALLIGKTKDEIVLSDPYFYFRLNPRAYTAYIYTNRPVYRPGQEVFFKAIIRKQEGLKLQNAPSEEFNVKIKSSRNDEVYSKGLKTNKFGSLSGSLKLDDDANLGTYRIQISKDNQTYYGSFSVEEYKKPEYKVDVTSKEKNYAAGDTLKANIAADYYFGSPVTNANVTVKVYKENYWRPWWYFSDYAWFYRTFDSDKIHGYGQREFIYQQKGKLDKNGKYNFSYFVGKKLSSDFIYIIDAEVTDAARHTVSGNSSVYVTRGSFTISTSAERFFVPTGNPINLRVNAFDFSDKPIQTDFKLVVDYPEQKFNTRDVVHPISDTLTGSTDKFGKATVTFLPRRLFSGHYRYTVIAKDKKGREISAKNSFFMGSFRHYYYGRDRNGLQIVTDKDAYEKGDSLIAYIFFPQNDNHVLVTSEANNIIDYGMYNVKSNTLTIKKKLTADYAPSFNLSITFMKHKQLYTKSKLVGVLDKDKLLHISIEPSKKIYKPGEEASYKIIVKDNNGNPVKNTELSFGVVDESIYAIKDDNTPDIKNFFYSPKYSYIPTYTSLQNNNYNGSSRYATFLDKTLIKNENEISPKGNSTLSGKVKTEQGKVDYSKLYVMLNGKQSFYKTTVDTSGNYKFTNIPSGKYDLLVYLDDGEMFLAANVDVKNKTALDINLGNYTNRVPRRFPRMPFNLRMEKSTITANDAVQAVYAPAANKKLVQPKLRKNFVDASIWKAHLVTGDNGTADVSFKMPDNLTTWRATVKGATVNTDVGQQINKVITRKNLLVRMETPRFFREGDELLISTIVHNYLKEDKRVKVEFLPGKLTLISSQINSSGYTKIKHGRNQKSFNVKVEKNSEVRIDWKVKVSYPIGQAKLIAKALTNEESDAVELKVPILPKGFKQVEPLVTDINNNSQNKDLSFKIPGNIDLRTAKLSFTVNPSLAGTMLQALDDLTGYPYGCVEQTMSRFLPTIIVANTFKQLDAPLKAKTIEELPKMVKAGLKRLYNFQHHDGGWGWWENDKTHPYMTAYVIYGMSLARKAGYKVDDNVYKRGIENLKAQIKNLENENFTTEAYMLYSLTTALKDSASDKTYYTDKIKSLLKNELNPYAVSLAALSLNNIGDKTDESNAVDKLIKQAEENNSFAYWGGKAWHYSWHNDKVQSTAFAVKALLASNRKSELVEKAVRWLMLQKKGYSWRSTQETATVLFALTDYLKRTNELNPDYTVKVYLNNKEILEKQFTKADVYSHQASINIDGNENHQLKHGTNKIRIVKEGKGKLYFSGLNEFYSPKEMAGSEKQFEIKRDYYVLKPVNEGDKIVFTKSKFTGKVLSGQVILVKTHVNVKDKGLQYFILEDMLPSGFEVIKDEQNYQIEGEKEHPRRYYNLGMIPWRWFYADKEYRDSKVSFFVTNTKQSMDFSYLIRAEIPGDYNAMPAHGYLMYYPSVGSNSKIVNIKVDEK